jgi:UDP-glucose 6-dehydrogenase
MNIGFIGQGYVGKSYADFFEQLGGHRLVRYALEAPYVENKDRIATCDVVIIGVPTPTTPTGFDDSIVRAAIGLVGPGKIAVIKSTIIPGTTVRLQQEFPDRTVLYSPEFLSEATAAHDAAHPFANIVGVAAKTPVFITAAETVLALLPQAPYSSVCLSTEAEIIKYSHNGSGYMQVVFFNMMYDLTRAVGVDWSAIEGALLADPMISNRYAKPVHKSGRGAGGHCFIKDFRALEDVYARALPQDASARSVFQAVGQKNLELLVRTGKDLPLVEGVYGTDHPTLKQKKS